MNVSILSAAALGLAAMAYSGAPERAAAPQGPVGLVGATLYASESPIDRWGDPVLAEDLPLEGLGTVASVRLGPEGEAEGLVVAVGGLWGYGARTVELGMDRVHLVDAREGGERLVVDLSAEGAEPQEG